MIIEQHESLDVLCQLATINALNVNASSNLVRSLTPALPVVVTWILTSVLKTIPLKSINPKFWRVKKPPFGDMHLSLLCLTLVLKTHPSIGWD